MLRISTAGGAQLKHVELTETIIGVFFDVYNELGFGFGFLKSVYRKSLQFALREKNLKVDAEVAVPVFFRGINVGDFRAAWLSMTAYFSNSKLLKPLSLPTKRKSLLT